MIVKERESDDSTACTLEEARTFLNSSLTHVDMLLGQVRNSFWKVFDLRSEKRKEMLIEYVLPIEKEKNESRLVVNVFLLRGR